MPTSRDSFDLIQLKKNPPWTFSPESKVTLTGAHGSDIVRAFCFLDSVWFHFGDEYKHN